MYLYLELIGLWSQPKDGTLSPEQTTAKVNCVLRSHYLHATAVARSPLTLLVVSPCIQFSAPRLATMTDSFCSFPQSLRTTRIRYSSVGTVTRLQNCVAQSPVEATQFSLFQWSTALLRPTQPPIQWITVVKRPGRNAVR